MSPRRARPDRHRQQHDVGGGKAGDADALGAKPDRRAFADASLSSASSAALKPARSSASTRSALLTPAALVHRGNALGGEVGARATRRPERRRALLDLAHAAAAMHVLDRQRRRGEREHRRGRRASSRRCQRAARLASAGS